MKFLSDTISAHQGLTATLIAILVVVIIVLIYYVIHYRSVAKEGLDASPPVDANGFPLDTGLVYSQDNTHHTAAEIRHMQRQQTLAMGEDRLGDVSGDWQAPPQMVQATRGLLTGGEIPAMMSGPDMPPPTRKMPARIRKPRGAPVMRASAAQASATQSDPPTFWSWFTSWF